MQNHHVRAQVVLRVMTDVLYTNAAANLVPGAEAEAPPKKEPADSKLQLKSRLLFTRLPRLLIAATSIGVLRELPRGQ